MDKCLPWLSTQPRCKAIRLLSHFHSNLTQSGRSQDLSIDATKNSNILGYENFLVTVDWVSVVIASHKERLRWMQKLSWKNSRKQSIRMMRRECKTRGMYPERQQRVNKEEEMQVNRKSNCSTLMFSSRVARKLQLTNYLHQLHVKKDSRMREKRHQNRMSCWKRLWRKRKISSALSKRWQRHSMPSKMLMLK